MNITGSVVLFNTEKKMIDRVIESFFNSDKSDFLYLVDHSYDDSARDWYSNDSIKYIWSQNTGYGAGHNKAMRYCIDESKYHVVLNPDVYFEKHVLDGLFDFAESNPDAALLMPKILYPDNELQYLCKLLPTPADWFFRRFIKKVQSDTFDLKSFDYNQCVSIPYLSGCFMFLRSSAIKEVGPFDEQYFLHCEDTDLSRRLHKKYKTLFVPFYHVFHEHQKESHKNLMMLLIHIISTIKYFNKWGWFFDRERKQINKETLGEIQLLSSRYKSKSRELKKK